MKIYLKTTIAWALIGLILFTPSCSENIEVIEEHALETLLSDPDFVQVMEDVQTFRLRVQDEMDQGISVEIALENHKKLQNQIKETLDNLDEEYANFRGLLEEIQRKNLEGTPVMNDHPLTQRKGCFSLHYATCMARCAIEYAVCLTGASGSSVRGCSKAYKKCKSGCEGICNQR